MDRATSSQQQQRHHYPIRRKYLDVLKVLCCHLDTMQCTALLRQACPKLVIILVECVLNILHGNVPLSRRYQSKLQDEQKSAMRWQPWRDDRVSALQARGSPFKPGVRHFFVALFTHNTGNIDWNKLGMIMVDGVHLVNETVRRRKMPPSHSFDQFVHVLRKAYVPLEFIGNNKLHLAVATAVAEESNSSGNNNSLLTASDTGSASDEDDDNDDDDKEEEEEERKH
ncbi:hypothetical protein TSAR_015058 [Trichomalopsis sarcophagae]|uniref:Uncharacterized protein n=1 Tax=Trichomalopsis sarcophagae TaxID=543379 RepID=A0A232EJ09_9HYME|nr:hypothetical protein TSAR_015058 [Trichomalopsis sarcophagae]